MPKKSAKPLPTTAWALFDKDDGDIRTLFDPDCRKPMPGYKHFGVVRVNVIPITPKK